MFEHNKWMNHDQWKVISRVISRWGFQKISANICKYEYNQGASNIKTLLNEAKCDYNQLKRWSSVITMCYLQHLDDCYCFDTTKNHYDKIEWLVK